MQSDWFQTRADLLRDLLQDLGFVLLQKKNKNFIYWPRSVRIGKPTLRRGHSQFPNTDLPVGE